MLAVAQALEEGRFQGSVARALSRVWAKVTDRSLVRPAVRPGHVGLVAIGGATLGGSGKTPLAIASARVLARAGARVALVGHAYRARPDRARVVSSVDVLAEVGDEALVAAAALQAEGVAVVVAPTRQQAIALASTMADVLVVDGVVQTAPRASLAFLAVDVAQPWGRAAAPPPCGDLRADPAALRSVVDRVVRVGDDSPDATVLSAGARLRDSRETSVSWAELAGLRVGLITALARPDRVLAFLTRRGVTPRVVVRAADHGPVAHRELRRLGARLDLWLASPKCALHVPWMRSLGRPDLLPALAVIDHDLRLSKALELELAGALP